MNAKAAKVVVRRLGPDDAPEYVRLRTEMLACEPFSFFGTLGEDRGCDEAHMRGQLTQAEYAVLGAERPGFPAALIGAAGIYRDQRAKARHRACVWGVYCTPWARGLGAGRMLMVSCIQLARSWPGVAVVCLSASERNIPARRLYESLGFVPWGLEPESMRINGEPDAEVHMQLRL